MVSLPQGVSARTRVFAVLGHPVAHSLSPAMQNTALRLMGLDAVYVAFDVAPERLERALRGMAALGFGGVNVTVPLKEEAARIVDELSPLARRLGAVNTILFTESGIAGDNTDAPGFLNSLPPGTPVEGERAVVLGAGGSARAIVAALADAGAEVILANRTPERAESLLAEVVGSAARAAVCPLRPDAVAKALSEAAILVNTTSVGMSPREEEMPPVPPEALGPRLTVVDLIYNPEETRLLAAARRAGCRFQNGIATLAAQGALSLERWTGLPAPREAMEDAVRRALDARRGAH